MSPRPDPRGERGMTLVEVTVAMLILVGGVFATIAVLDRSRDVTSRSEAREAAAFHAERELERVIALPWGELGHPSQPADTGAPTPSDPMSYVSGTGYQFDRDNLTRVETLKVIVSPPGQVASTPSAWTDNQSRLSGKLYRFVTDVNATTRRVTVVATVDAGVSNPAAVPPALLSTLVSNPSP